MKRILKRVWSDIKSGENLDLYVTIIVAIYIVVAGLLDMVSQTTLLSVLLAVFTVLVVDSLKRRSDFQVVQKAEQDVLSSLEEMNARIHGLETRIGIPPEIIFEPVESRTGKLYRRLTEYINQASSGDEIYILAHYSGPYGGYVSTEEFEKARHEYSQALLKKAREEGVVYRRVVSFSADDGAFTSVYVGEWLVEHAKGMLEIARRKPGKISLKKGKPVVGPEILVIKNKVGMIAIEVRDVKTGLPHTTGGIIFHNPPNGELIKQLTDFFMMADSQSVPVKNL